MPIVQGPTTEYLFEDMPKLYTRYGYVVILGLPVMLVALMLHYLHRKRML